MGANGVFCTKGVSCTSDKANKIENIEAGFITDRTTAFNLEQFEKFSKNGEIDTKSKTIILCNCLFMIHRVEISDGSIPFYWTSNKLERYCLNIKWMCYGFKQTNIELEFSLLWWVEHNFIEHRMNSNMIFRTWNELERVHLLVIELEHPIFGFLWSNIELRT